MFVGLQVGFAMASGLLYMVTLLLYDHVLQVTIMTESICCRPCKPFSADIFTMVSFNLRTSSVTFFIRAIFTVHCEINGALT